MVRETRLRIPVPCSLAIAKAGWKIVTHRSGRRKQPQGYSISVETAAFFYVLLPVVVSVALLAIVGARR
jgi:hypothetical protein